jgi:chorismate mutase/prephenate dehydratase
MSGSIALEKKLTVAYLGPEASFSHIAAKNKFGESVLYEPHSDIPSVFKAVSKKHTDYGIVPIENSTEGGVNDTIDMFTSTDTTITAEIYQHIQHNLLAKCTMCEISRVYSKHTVFGQCKNWLAENLPKIELVETVSTTRSAEIASKEKNSAAIASTMCAEKYGLPILFSSIEDNEHNVTRFFILSKNENQKSSGQSYKTSIMISLKDKIGALHDMLIPFKTYNINLTRIESRPSRQKAWEYYFFIDFEGYYADRNESHCLKELAESVKEVKILGSYPKADTIY